MEIEITKIDPNFAKNKKIPVHRWVPWIAGFSNDFVDSAVDRHLNGEGKKVLDPFCGVGTSLLCVIHRGHNAVGFEINPYAELATKVKTNAHKVNPNSLRAEIDRFKDYYLGKTFAEKPKSAPPPKFKTKKDFYSPRVLRKVLRVQDFIKTIPDERISELFNLAFGSTMVQYSNYSYEPSLGTREGAGKEDILDYDVSATIAAKLEEMLKDILYVAEKAQSTRMGNAKVICDSFFKYREHVEKNSVDLIVTSPPYLNNYHYVRNTRPQLYWLGFVTNPSDLKYYEIENFGKYWQTVRQAETIELKFRYEGSEIDECINKIRRVNPHRGVYGGHGWANYVTSYLNDCHRFALGIKYCLKRGGVANVVIGNNIIQGVQVPTDVFLGKIAKSVGLELVGIHTPRKKRIGNSIIRSTARVEKASKGARLYESIVEIMKN